MTYDINNGNNSSNAQILVVDDTAANLKLLVDILNIAGFSVRPAPSGKFALRSIALELPDIILLDVNMPEMNGYEVAKIIKSDSQYKDIPIIFISALDDTTNKVKGFEAGGVDYITKPFQTAEILARINTHLTIRKLQMETVSINAKLFEENKIRRAAELSLNEHKNNLEITIRRRTQELLESNQILHKEVQIRKDAEAQLKESQERYKAIFDNSGEALALINSEGTILMINREFEKLIVNTKENIENKRKWTDYVLNKEGIARLITHEIRKRRTTENWSSSFYFQIISTSGIIHDVQAIVSIIPGISQAIVALSDITDEKKAEEEKNKLKEQLTQSQKMEAIGNLAGGIAHDFNNILTGIIGSGEMLQLTIPKDSAANKYINQIMSLSDKAANITKRLLSFSRKQYFDLKPIPASAIFEDNEKLLRMLLTEDIELQIEQSPKEMYLYADVTQLYQVIMNLVSNAKDAMTKGGKISITTEEIEMNEEFITANSFGKIGKYLKIILSDSGIGMSEETMQKAFEPFFTTKEVGKGTGLGLSIVYGIVTQHNGYINISSEKGKGTTFFIYLPLIAPKIADNNSTKTNSAGGNETILIADDNNEVRQFVSMFLKMKGYNTIEAKDGEDAVNQYKALYQSIDLLILDVVMPKKNGKEVADEVKKVNPNANILFISGYTSDIISNKGVDDGEINFVTKPITPTKLYEAVRNALDSKS